MFAPHKRVTRWMFFHLTSFLLLLFLSACGSGGSSSSAATPTLPPKAPTATTTPAQTAQWQTYTGLGFTIRYPQAWQKTAGQNAVDFYDPTNTMQLRVLVVANPGGAVSANAQATTELTTLESGVDYNRVSHVQPINLPATTNIGSETWVQRGINDMATLETTNGGTTSYPATLILLVDNHPANLPTTRTYEMYYEGATTRDFQPNNPLIFQPMLQSFSFTA